MACRERGLRRVSRSFVDEPQSGFEVRMVSPTTEKREMAGFDQPGVTGPTGSLDAGP